MSLLSCDAALVFLRVYIPGVLVGLVTTRKCSSEAAGCRLFRSLSFDSWRLVVFSFILRSHPGASWIMPVPFNSICLIGQVFVARVGFWREYNHPLRVSINFQSSWFVYVTRTVQIRNVDRVGFKKSSDSQVLGLTFSSIGKFPLEIF